MNNYYMIFVLYSGAVILGAMKYDGVRYRLLFGYLFGLLSGAGALLLTDINTAIIISVMLGSIANVKMMMSPNGS